MNYEKKYLKYKKKYLYLKKISGGTEPKVEDIVHLYETSDYDNTKKCSSASYTLTGYSQEGKFKKKEIEENVGEPIWIYTYTMNEETDTGYFIAFEYKYTWGPRFEGTKEQPNSAISKEEIHLKIGDMIAICIKKEKGGEKKYKPSLCNATDERINAKIIEIIDNYKLINKEVSKKESENISIESEMFIEVETVHGERHTFNYDKKFGWGSKEFTFSFFSRKID